jgi:hypothetical protein
MSIDATVHAELYTNDDAYGIFIDGTDVNSIQEINGTFNIDAQNGYGVYYNEVCRGNTIVNGSFLISGVMKAIGVDFPTTIQKSKQTINGNFVLNTSSQSISQDNTIIGVFFYNDVNSIVNINGTFEINSFTIGIGVYFQEEVLESSRITTKGTFDVNAGFYGYGYRFNKGIYNGAYIEIDGFAKVKSNTANPGGLPTEPEACAIYFNSNLESNLLINGTFLVNAV